MFHILIYFLSIIYVYVQSLEPGVAIPKMLTTTMENIKRLCFSGVGFHDLVQIKYVLCLIRSSPNLQHLLLGPVRTEVQAV